MQILQITNPRVEDLNTWERHNYVYLLFSPLIFSCFALFVYKLRGIHMSFINELLGLSGDRSIFRHMFCKFHVRPLGSVSWVELCWFFSSCTWSLEWVRTLLKHAKDHTSHLPPAPKNTHSCPLLNWTNIDAIIYAVHSLQSGISPSVPCCSWLCGKMKASPGSLPLGQPVLLARAQMEVILEENMWYK